MLESKQKKSDVQVQQTNKGWEVSAKGYQRTFATGAAARITARVLRNQRRRVK